MRPSSVTQVGVGDSVPIPVDIYCPSSDKGVFLEVTGTVIVTVQVTPDNIYDPAVTPTWYSPDLFWLIGATDNQQGTVHMPCRALRLHQTSGTGTSKLTVVQQSIA